MPRGSSADKKTVSEKGNEKLFLNQSTMTVYRSLSSIGKKKGVSLLGGKCLKAQQRISLY